MQCEQILNNTHIAHIAQKKNNPEIYSKYIFTFKDCC